MEQLCEQNVRLGGKF